MYSLFCTELSSAFEKGINFTLSRTLSNVYDESIGFPNMFECGALARRETAVPSPVAGKLFCFTLLRLRTNCSKEMYNDINSEIYFCEVLPAKLCCGRTDESQTLLGHKTFVHIFLCLYAVVIAVKNKSPFCLLGRADSNQE